MDSNKNIASTFGNNEAIAKPSNPKQTAEAHTPQSEPKPTHTSDEALATQTSVDEDQIVAQVVDDINATEGEEEIGGDGGGEKACESKVSPENPFLICNFGG